MDDEWLDVSVELIHALINWLISGDLDEVGAALQEWKEVLAVIVVLLDLLGKDGRGDVVRMVLAQVDHSLLAHVLAAL